MSIGLSIVIRFMTFIHCGRARISLPAIETGCCRHHAGAGPGR